MAKKSRIHNVPDEEENIKEIEEKEKNIVIQENQDEPVEEKTDKIDNLSIEEEKEIIVNVGDKVKINPDVSNDMLGRRIHNGVKNYQYTIKNVRPDGYCTLECLTHVFTLNKNEFTVIK